MTNLETAREVLLALVVCILATIFHSILSSVLATVACVALVISYVSFSVSPGFLEKVDRFLLSICNDPNNSDLHREDHQLR